mmetsp:Transcript_18627/g.37758  ORF Transcript_18627/g.37758 Transcript_18627/m.37758 type:complete len:304 (+) Transcript_18627:1313-2224(+)
MLRQGLQTTNMASTEVAGRTRHSTCKSISDGKSIQAFEGALSDIDSTCAAEELAAKRLIVTTPASELLIFALCCGARSSLSEPSALVSGTLCFDSSTKSSCFHAHSMLMPGQISSQTACARSRIFWLSCHCLPVTLSPSKTSAATEMPNSSISMRCTRNNRRHSTKWYRCERNEPARFSFLQYGLIHWSSGRCRRARWICFASASSARRYALLVWSGELDVSVIITSCFALAFDMQASCMIRCSMPSAPSRCSTYCANNGAAMSNWLQNQTVQRGCALFMSRSAVSLRMLLRSARTRPWHPGE